ncbi:MAG TPA: hypothetical protein VN578_15790 [Candidatus Binatia bacterium]|nr:hypothetical protein [Candidatus Binatia bacterium]
MNISPPGRMAERHSHPLSEYKPGDRTALLEAENHTKALLAYDGPYVECLTNSNWTEYSSDVPEMENLKQTHRTGPTQSSVWSK